MRFSHDVFTQLLILFFSVSCVEAKAGQSLVQELKMLNNQGIGQYFSGDYSTALSTFQKSLKIIKKMSNVENTDIALSYESIADTYQAIGNFSMALEYAQKALEIDEKMFGKEHFITAEGYARVGTAHQLMENYTEALKYFHKTLAIYTSIYGEEDFTTASSSLAICDVYSAMGEHSKAED